MKFAKYHIYNYLIIGLLYAFFAQSLYRAQAQSASILDIALLTIYSMSLIQLIRVILIYPITKLAGFVSTKLSQFLSYFLEIMVQYIVFLNIKVFVSQGIHLYDRVVIKTLSNPNFNREIQLTTELYISIFLLFLSIVLVQYIIRRFANHLNFPGKKGSVFFYIFLPLINLYTVFLYLPSSGDIANIFPLYTPLKGSPGQSKLLVNYPYSKEIQNLEKSNTDVDIVYIMAESLRSDFYNQTYMPNTNNFFSGMNCVKSKRHYSGGHTTEYGVFTALYGVHGLHYDDFRKENTPSYAIDILKNNGFKVLGYSASQLSDWNGAGFIFNNFDEYKEYTTSDIIQDDLDTIYSALNSIQANKTHSKFIYLFLNSTHHNYFFPDRLKKYMPIAEQNYNHFKVDNESVEFRNKIRNRYKNSTLYLDETISTFLNKSKALLKKKRIYIFTGDHGEEFWEEGVLGHGKTSYINPKTQVPLVFCYEGFDQIPLNKEVTAHTQIMPSILELTKLSHNTEAFNSPNFINDDIKYGIFVGPQFPYGRNKMGVFTKNYKYWLKKPTEKLHHLYGYRTTDLSDNNIFGEVAKNELQEILKLFKVDAYKFLKEIEP